MKDSRYGMWTAQFLWSKENPHEFDDVEMMKGFWDRYFSEAQLWQSRLGFTNENFGLARGGARDMLWPC